MATDLTSPPAHGTTARVGNALVYTAQAGFVGPDSFTATATDGFGAATTATVTVEVRAAPPVVPPAADLAIQLVLSAPGEQRLRSPAVTGGCGAESCTLAVTGRVKVTRRLDGRRVVHRFDLRPTSGVTAAGGQRRVPLAVENGRALRLLLGAGGRAKATVTVTAIDAAGNLTRS